MIVLTKNEIFSQLNKIGINSHSEINSYFKEYIEYYFMVSCCIYSRQEYCKRMKDEIVCS